MVSQVLIAITALAALTASLGALLTTPRRATVKLLREQLQDLSAYVKNLERRLADALGRLSEHEGRLEETERSALRRRGPDRRAS